MFDRLKAALKNIHLPSAERDEEAYLNGATSIYDLERREREIERGLFRGNRSIL